ncbi:bacillithiol biosynthesis deacetylase BshB2 [Peribacillus simplex]|uniref:Bacillithiol biosynthesis deacetylase BshB2 n=2 Tax=Peribacillus simplex TaxID=1478 RepID=A0A223EI03_9BACI|nr:bacillithiol biosynthesis deacetylase BshB2 [Peribacillus simplex]ASS94705.1 bacillithiol biosynthesis deacetylase BshB2 [Peribacillus simplex NBRC 15720 = DSM 1321]MEC1396842.1 bacillithiol biosynthesis deacetylase BshB2 [Peribacillus simplex]MED3908176.1 bacillithiol biosynthesis deacetylase BshB2 [Peribacillus simplex]MED3983311.1 bacillithiol biosynthesis deacetylase BshB2 [Peribacillus simplex]MED4092411.1 bacillithiol biosynthesis deacetylase BshB2 [Peribacillus simplex]
MEKERHVLVIFPHPDDEAFSVSGTLALHREAGTPVTYLCLTLGEMGRNLGNPPFATRESLPKIRKKELIDAANAIGIQDLRMLGLRDKTIEFEDDEKLTSLFTDAINELNPSLIITFYPGYSVHPDHEATARAVVRAVERIEEKERPKLHCVAFSNNCIDELGHPDIIHDISAVEEKKVATFTAHRSQTQAMVIDWKEKFENQDADFLDWIRKERLWTYKF